MLNAEYPGYLSRLYTVEISLLHEYYQVMNFYSAMSEKSFSCQMI
jgi:hypothetical protein